MQGLRPISCTLTLVQTVGYPGCGKTTILSSYIATRARRLYLPSSSDVDRGEGVNENRPVDGGGGFEDGKGSESGADEGVCGGRQSEERNQGDQAQPQILHRGFLRHELCQDASTTGSDSQDHRDDLDGPSLTTICPQGRPCRWEGHEDFDLTDLPHGGNGSHVIISGLLPLNWHNVEALAEEGSSEATSGERADYTRVVIGYLCGDTFTAHELLRERSKSEESFNRARKRGVRIMETVMNNFCAFLSELAERSSTHIRAELFVDRIVLTTSAAEKMSNLIAGSLQVANDPKTCTNIRLKRAVILPSPSPPQSFSLAKSMSLFSTPYADPLTESSRQVEILHSKSNFNDTEDWEQWSWNVFVLMECFLRAVDRALSKSHDTLDDPCDAIFILLSFFKSLRPSQLSHLKRFFANPSSDRPNEPYVLFEMPITLRSSFLLPYLPLAPDVCDHLFETFPETNEPTVRLVRRKLNPSASPNPPISVTATLPDDDPPSRLQMRRASSPVPKMLTELREACLELMQTCTPFERRSCMGLSRHVARLCEGLIQELKKDGELMQMRKEAFHHVVAENVARLECFLAGI